jgi:hypothetical protein
VGWDASSLPPGTRRWDPVLLAGVGAATVGVAGFLAIGQPTAGRADIGFGALVPLAIALVAVVGSCLVTAARNSNLRPLALALACGACYGVAAFTVKLVTTEFGSGPARVFTNWPIYMLAIVAPVGFILNQDAFQQGKFLAPVQSIVTTADPVISIGLGLVLLGVVLHGSPAAIVGEVVSLLIMTAGVVVTAHRASPRSQHEQAVSPLPQSGHGDTAGGSAPLALALLGGRLALGLLGGRQDRHPEGELDLFLLRPVQCRGRLD